MSILDGKKLLPPHWQEEQYSHLTSHSKTTHSVSLETRFVTTLDKMYSSPKQAPVTSGQAVFPHPAVLQVHGGF